MRILIAALVMVGCAPPSSPDEKLFSVTEVHLDGTKSEIVAEEMVTSTQWKQMFAPESVRNVGNGIAAAEQAITNTTCSSSTLKLQDNSVAHCALFQDCNVICFTGSGTATLNSFCRTHGGGLCTSRWKDNVGSYFPGGNSGFIDGHLNDVTPFCNNYSGTSGIDNPDAPFAEDANIGSSC
jgi:hypothetical protein